MKCVICGSQAIEDKDVEEVIRVDNDIIIVDIKVKACRNCGERYYDRKTMQYLEEIEEKLRKKKLNVKTVGRVLRLTEVIES